MDLKDNEPRSTQQAAYRGMVVVNELTENGWGRGKITPHLRKENINKRLEKDYLFIIISYYN